MKASEFIEEWSRTHTSQPSYQDVIDWVESKYKYILKLHEEAEKSYTNSVKLRVINKASEWLNSRNILTEDSLVEFINYLNNG